jgi:hypothetical protein
MNTRRAFAATAAVLSLTVAFAIPASASSPSPEVRITGLDVRAIGCEASTLNGLFAPSYRCSWTLLFDGAVDKIDLAEQALTAR